MEQKPKKINVLSIDFDFFQKVTHEIIALHYPDGVDREIDEAMMIWGEILLDKEKRKIIESVKVNINEIRVLQEILSQQKSNTRAMICNSHINIFDFIKKNVPLNRELNLINVDMHHDIYNDNKECMDCGNWISYTKKEYEHFQLGWIANPISKSVYGFSEEECPENVVPTSLKAISGQRFDVIFLCRSDIWTPPHLDMYFIQLVNTMKGVFNSIIIEDGIDECRSTDDIIRAVEETKNSKLEEKLHNMK